MSDQVRRAWAYLSRVAEQPCAEMTTLVRQVGPVDAAHRIKRGGGGEELARRTEARREIDCAAEDLEVLDRIGGRLITPADSEWPLLSFAAFGGADAVKRPQARPPVVLWAVGPERLTDVTERACAVVGTRAATAYGEHVAADLAAGLVERDVAVVSGGAYGIDGAAHRAALAGEGVTVAVLAGGIDVPYPAGHTAMLRQVQEQGLLVSEYPPGTRPTRHRFLTRNRLVAALTGATVVVEAGLRSGAANTASWAKTLGRPVGAVPGPVTSSASAGCHVLLRARAEVITRAEDIVELVGRMGELATEPDRQMSPLDDLAENELRVYDALPARGARTTDQIAVAAGIPPTKIMGPLAMLELAGLVTRHEGKWKLVRR
jgi:DNA processing protein